ncbi:pimeloyl-ACP methyl ester carboxylesterase [Ureibacillus xyleni]|uniref:Pimeloyl-ACP methyl ester carboxylesterase n=1 Tax=Ureibacillus xyleni TaxID=614648 RepID=A0A285SSD9_9BACL|nr:alpha/beta fold hydrolase [Ureibacillus xyleni]SOC11269.1 pimeloyl-ACP methyl ester carboxylesterase [Ureibacillus xyleni]
MNKKRDFVIPASGIDSVEKVRLGGVDQAILIQGYDTSKPILLFIHGGPCMAIPGVVSRGQDYNIATTTKELVKQYVVVFWDQRGAGKSYHRSILQNTIRVEQYISDCNELVDLLRQRFSQDKIYLAGHSWGSFIGLLFSSRYSEKLHAYIGISQLLNWVENDQLCYQWLKTKAEQAKDKKTLKKLEELGLPPYTKSVKQWISFRSPLTKYKSMVYESDTVKHSGMVGGLKLFFTSSEYSILDIFHTFYSAYKLTYTQELIEDFAKIDLHQISDIEIPVYFLHGSHDAHVDGSQVVRFYNNLKAPSGKKLIWFENSSHMFHLEDARKIEQFLIDLVS